MRLSELFDEKEKDPVAIAAEDFEVTGLTADSRRVRQGYLFAAIPGHQQDGRAFIGEAMARGAVAILAPSGTHIEDRDRLKSNARPVLLICDDEPRRRLALMAALFYKQQPRHIAAVTGTNGKTSVASFTRQIWTALGRRAASLGTLGLQPPRADAPAALTTPDPVELMRCLADLAGDGFDHLAMEASSHGLDQFRLDGVRVSAAAFTNLSRDHLDYHADMAGYFAAKQRLFTELLPQGATAVLNADIPEFEALAAGCRARGQRVLSYGTAGRDLKLLSLTPRPGRLDLEVEVLGLGRALSLPLAGTFQAWNALAALGLVLAETGDLEAALDSLSGLTGVPGRVELVGQTAQGAHVYVDYAHTPDALETVLRALRPHTRGALTVVFGCGGDRDPGKRPMMGEIARRLADRSIVTDDNPRSEEPAAIRHAILTAVPEAIEFDDRGEAIASAIASLGPGDTLVIAGKGHETGQTVGDRVLPFDDRVVARAALSSLAGGRP